jgi:hypothetical protein
VPLGPQICRLASIPNLPTHVTAGNKASSSLGNSGEGCIETAGMRGSSPLREASGELAFIGSRCAQAGDNRVRFLTYSWYRRLRVMEVQCVMSLLSLQVAAGL